VDYAADLTELDEELWRVGGDDEDVWVWLDEDAGFFFVDFAEVVAGSEGLGDASFEVFRLGDAGAVGALAAVVGEAVGFGGGEAVYEASVHEGEGVFARATAAGEDDGLGNALVEDALAEALHSSRVAEKLLEAHDYEATRKSAAGGAVEIEPGGECQAVKMFCWTKSLRNFPCGS
jgi:hypothetical protein